MSQSREGEGGGGREDKQTDVSEKAKTGIHRWTKTLTGERNSYSRDGYSEEWPEAYSLIQ